MVAKSVRSRVGQVPSDLCLTYDPHLLYLPLEGGCVQ